MRNSKLFTCIAITLFITACSRDPKPGTPQAAAMGERYMRSMSDTLGHARTFTFETDEQLEVLGSTGGKKTVRFTRKVTVRRPNGLYFELDGTGDGAPEIAAYYDGRTATLSQKPDGVWAQAAVPATLDDMLDDVARRFGLPVPIGDVVYSSPYDAFIGKTTKGGFVGRETIDGVSCVKLDYADEYVEVRLWLPASGPALPRRLEIDYKRAPIPLTSHVDFKNWKLDLPVTDATFAFQPPAGHAPVEFGDFVDGMRLGTISLGRRDTGSPPAPGTKPVGAPAAN
ncbi:MAG TPA: DUF2092 domain-containing protein [Silvibacterium sp.]|jgi:hypothetical protein|nr:DUF2092 domain-containing protein [Silvibacterium sp.]